MLSHEDERRLAEIERHLVRDDPEFARRLAAVPGAAPPWSRRVATSLLLIGALAVVVGLLLASAAVVLLGIWSASGTIWLFMAARRRTA